MITKLIFVVTCLFIPFFIILGVKLYKTKNISKVQKVLAIVVFAIGLFRFFYNAKLYYSQPDNHSPIASDLTFSFISLLSVLILFGAFNKQKFGKTLNYITIFSSLIPLIFGLICDRPFTNSSSLDEFYVLPATYYLQTSLLITYACIEMMELKKKVKLLNLFYVALISLGLWVLYVVLMVATNYYWKLNISYNVEFYLSITLPILGIGLVYLALYLLQLFYVKKFENAEEKPVLENKNNNENTLLEINGEVEIKENNEKIKTEEEQQSKE